MHHCWLWVQAPLFERDLGQPVPGTVDHIIRYLMGGAHTPVGTTNKRPPMAWQDAEREFYSNKVCFILKSHSTFVILQHSTSSLVPLYYE